MRISRVSVKNFRALADCSMSFQPVTTVVGENNSGKSAFLQAIRLFFSSSTKAQLKDHTNEDISQPIEITIQFKDFTPGDLARFGQNIIDNKLTVTRVMSYNSEHESGKFFADALVNSAFSEVRNEAKASKKNTLYKDLQSKFDGLESVKKADDIEAQLTTWESNNPEQLSVTRLGGFVGFPNVAAGYIKENTDFIFVPAAKEANDFLGEKDAPAKELLSTIARQALENKIEFQDFVERTSEEISRLTDPQSVPELATINEDISKVLKKYYSDSQVETLWDKIDSVPINFPLAKINVINNRYSSPIDSVGHGLQRAVILSILEYMAQRENEAGDEDFSEAQSDIILGIEEPEAYQHPTKQRLFAEVLRSLSEGFAKTTGIRFQVLMVSHSPNFVEMSRCHEVRLVRREPSGDRSNVTVSEMTLSDCSRRLAIASGRDVAQAFSDEAMAAKLHIFTREHADGFFSRCVILVEGVSDQAILQGWFTSKGRVPGSEGIEILQTNGKNNLDRPLTIFQELGIPVFSIFDNDKKHEGKKKQTASISSNHLLQRILSEEDGSIADWPEGVKSTWAALPKDLEGYIRGAAGDEVYDAARVKISESFGIDEQSCLKTPATASATLSVLVSKGVDFGFFEEVLDRVDQLLS